MSTQLKKANNMATVEAEQAKCPPMEEWINTMWLCTYNGIRFTLKPCQWLMPVIPATQEAEIRRIVVQSQPRQTVHKILSQKKNPSLTKGLVEWFKV
jgi:hypothetical protein